MTLRVAFYGNIANNFFQLARSVRERSDIDAHLFLDAVDRRDEVTMRPENDDPSLRDAYPDWIHTGSYFTALSVAMPWRSPLVKEFQDFDLVVVSGIGPAIAQFAGRPWGFFVTGADLTMIPFPLRFFSRWRTARGRLAMLGMGTWQRRGIRRADEIWGQLFSPFQIALERLDVDSGRVSKTYLPVIFDATGYARSANSSEDLLDREILSALERSDFVVFHPSRIMMDDSQRAREIGQWKGNDVLVRGFAEFVESGIASAPLLVIPVRDASLDMGRARALVEDLGIEASVLWARPPRPSGFTRHELTALYSAANVVADDFGIGWFGAVVLEALSLGRPVLSHLDEAVMQELYPWHPVLDAATPSEVAERLTALATDPEFAAEVGKRGAAWVHEFHSYESATAKYVEAFNALAERKRAARTGPRYPESDGPR